MSQQNFDFAPASLDSGLETDQPALSSSSTHSASPSAPAGFDRQSEQSAQAQGGAGDISSTSGRGFNIGDLVKQAGPILNMLGIGNSSPQRHHGNRHDNNRRQPHRPGQMDPQEKEELAAEKTFDNQIKKVYQTLLSKAQQGKLGPDDIENQKMVIEIASEQFEAVVDDPRKLQRHRESVDGILDALDRRAARLSGDYKRNYDDVDYSRRNPRRDDDCDPRDHRRYERDYDRRRPIYRYDDRRSGGLRSTSVSSDGAENSVAYNPSLGDGGLDDL